MADPPGPYAAGNSDDGAQALAESFLEFRGRLRQAVQLRLDRRLAGRVDPSDVLQEAFLDAMARAGEYQPARSSATTAPPAARSFATIAPVPRKVASP